MVRQHQEQHGQRQIVVVRRTLLRLLSERRIGRATCDQVGNNLFLVRDDDEEHIGRHDGCREGAEMQIGGPAREELGVAPRDDDEDEIEQHHQPRIVVAERRTADHVIGKPAEAKRSQRDGDCHRLRDVEHVRIDEVEVRAGIIDERKHAETREPGDVGLPFEPDQVLRHVFRRNQIFLDVVEAAAMHLPLFAIGADRHARTLLQPQVERDEVKG